VPRVTYTQQFKNPGEVDRFPKLKLAVAEKARIWIPEAAWMEYYHRIEAPFIEDGEPVMEVKNGKNGPYEAMKMQWIGNVFCLGDAGTPDDPGPMVLNGIDPANCPGCESAANGTGVAGPQQRFAAPVIKYKVKGRGTKPYELVNPISAEILVWAYTGRIHGMLFDLAAERGGDLRKCDVRIELEDTPGADTYQKIKTLAVIDTAAHADPKVREYITALWRDPDNRPTDEQLRDACLGRDVARPVFLDMVRRAERQWRDANRDSGSGGDSSAADAGFNGSLDEGIDALLDSGPKNEEATERIREMKEETRREVTDILSPDDPFADSTQAAPGATTTATSAPAAGSRSGTEPKSATSAAGSAPDPLPDDERAAAVEDAADAMFGESQGETAPPEPARNGGKAKPEPVKAEPEPAAVASGSGVVDFDDLFSD
jgi:hypothetical protein